MIKYTTSKLLFFVLDSVTLLAYLYVIKRSKLFVYFYLALFFGCCCLLTSIVNICNINDFISEVVDVRETSYLYLILRSYIYVIEWGQYLWFLRILKQNKFKLFVVALVISAVVIHAHYIGIEVIEENIISDCNFERKSMVQYISPFDLMFRNLFIA